MKIGKAKDVAMDKVQRPVDWVANRVTRRRIYDNMSSSYANDIASPEVEIAGDAVGGSFFADSKSRHADLKAMLDSSKDNLKMDAMKRIINMVAKGKDASDLFPAVVKNVAAKNLELKKLVYVYLVRYAEEQQDLALLSISTFQRALKDPNQLIRASALRVLSSIRVPMIAPIMMLSIKESMRDMSPYVRKVSAHGIPKLYSLDPEQKDQLIEVIDHLLADKATLVVGSAVYAFEELCPDRIDLIHKHYRKLCQVLVDVDEWGQVIIINMLTRYARSQFQDPNQGEEAVEEETKFYSSEESSEEGSDSGDKVKVKKQETSVKPYVMDPDLRMLLRNTKPLLQSRNSSVVLAVAQLYYHMAPKNEIGIIAKSLIRLLRGHREVQSVVLSNIATISAKRRNMFEPFLKSFFVRSSDPTHIKLLKLEILTNLATQSNISMILREFQTYVQTQDKEFASAAIDAIGRCASNINEVTDVCLSGLVSLMASKNETVVAQSVVVIKRLLQLQPAAHKDIIMSMAKLIDSVRVGAARASIVWLIGEYCQTVPTIAPDVLRKMAKTFINEEEMVKLQVLNLAVKLLLTNPEQTKLLVQYIFTLARYDQSYDLRDRARFLRNLVMPQKPNKLTQFSKKIFLTPKPAPVIESTFKDRDQYQLGTLSHYLNQRCTGYHDLPEFPETPPDPSARNVPGWGLPTEADKTRSASSSTILSSQRSPLKKKKQLRKKEKFYSDESDEEDSQEESSEVEDEEEETSSGEVEDEEEEESVEDEDEEEEEEEESSEEETEEEQEPVTQPQKHKRKESPPSVPAKASKHKENMPKRIAPASNTDLLLDLDFDVPLDPVGSLVPPLAPSGTQPLVPATASVSTTGKKSTKQERNDWQTAPAQYIPTRTYGLLDRLTGGGLVIVYRFTRSPSLFSSSMSSVELQLTNHSEKAVDIKLLDKKLQSGMELAGFPVSGSSVGVGQSSAITLGINFADTTQSVVLEMEVRREEDAKKMTFTIEAPVGEQLQPILLSPEQFRNEQTKLSGLNETMGKFPLTTGLSVEEEKTVSARIYDVANVTSVSGVEDKLCFAGQTLSGKSPVLICLAKTGAAADVKLVVNCEKMVIGSMLFKLLKAALSSA